MHRMWNTSNRSYVSEEATVKTVSFQTELADTGAQSKHLLKIYVVRVRLCN